jgi:Raf kinase inhibitor-like YbhB/YbcL family protein
MPLFSEESGVKMFELTSSAFADYERIPTKHANITVFGGQNISIPLSWTDAPQETKSFCLAMIDKHPVANSWVHWLIINIPTGASGLAEGASGTTGIPAGARELSNTLGRVGYGGPQPPSGTGDHDYETTLFALSIEKVLVMQNASFHQLLDVIQPHIVGSAQITGIFSR